MIKCECGVEKYTPKEARQFLEISAVSLNDWREKGFIQASDTMGTWHIYTKNSLIELKRELKRRTTEIEYDTR
jgi:predicted site-specific integrase-resolvase